MFDLAVKLELGPPLIILESMMESEQGQPNHSQNICKYHFHLARALIEILFLQNLAILCFSWEMDEATS